jgi:methyl-accepting chemotaxis protein
VCSSDLKIYDNLENISRVFQQISYSTQELDKGGKEISTGLGVINQASDENLLLSKEIDELTSQFDSESKKLNQIIKANKKVGIDLLRVKEK